MHATDSIRSTSGGMPRVVVSSVIRSSHQGESHGGVFLLDIAAGMVEQRVDWDDPAISWEGRGADRGLRGIAFHRGCIYLAASDEIFVYDTDFQLKGSFRNRYLKHCHEISIEGDSLYVTSTGFDSVLQYDLREGAFTEGYAFRFGKLERTRRRLGGRPLPKLGLFDPNSARGPAPGDSTHINNVIQGGRARETRIIKLWRDQKGLDFPSFYLELTVINALAGRYGSLSDNVQTVFQYLRHTFPNARVVDPANTNNIISDDLTAAERGRVRDAAAAAIAATNWNQIVT